MKNFFTLSFILFLLVSVKATHNRSGEILYKRIAPFTSGVGSATVQVYTYSITVVKYTDHGSAIADRCVDTVYFGDGQRGNAYRINGVASGTCNCGTIPCGEIIENLSGYIVKKSVYSIVHTYPGPGTYLIKSMDPNRNGGIHNIPNSVNLPFYIEAQMFVTANTGANSSPVLSNPPTDRGLQGTCMEINTCAFDADGDSLSYEISTPRDASGQTVAGYFYPETGTGGTFSIHPVTGLLTWCTPQFVDDYNIAIIVKEWRKTSCSGNYVLLGYVFRDFQVLIMSGSPATFSCSTLSDMCVKAGNSAVKTFSVNSNGVSTEVYGETASFATATAQIVPFFSSGSSNVTFSWLTNCAQTRKQAYDVNLVFKTTNTQKLYRQFKVTVIPQTPGLYTPVADTGNVILSWASCAINTAGYNIYRKTGINTWTPGTCEQGVSAASGFILVGTAPAGAVTFTDSNVWPILNGTTAHYIVTAYTKDCAESMGDNAQSVTLIVGINENKAAADLKFYPNPVTSEFKVNLGKTAVSRSECRIVDVTGKTVFEQQDVNVTGELNFNLSTLSAGVYIVCMNMDGSNTYTKIVKE